jgi:hypothetical protein
MTNKERFLIGLAAAGSTWVRTRADTPHQIVWIRDRPHNALCIPNRSSQPLLRSAGP